MDFEKFKKLDLSEIKKWQKVNLSKEEIDKWKQDGTLVDKIYELKLKKLYLEYMKIKLQNDMSVVDPFNGYDPIKEAESILEKL